MGQVCSGFLSVLIPTQLLTSNHCTKMLSATELVYYENLWVKVFWLEVCWFLSQFGVLLSGSQSCCQWNHNTAKGSSDCTVVFWLSVGILILLCVRTRARAYVHSIICVCHSQQEVSLLLCLSTFLRLKHTPHLFLSVCNTIAEEHRRTNHRLSSPD